MLLYCRLCYVKGSSFLLQITAPCPETRSVSLSLSYGMSTVVTDTVSLPAMVPLCPQGVKPRLSSSLSLSTAAFSYRSQCAWQAGYPIPERVDSSLPVSIPRAKHTSKDGKKRSVFYKLVFEAAPLVFQHVHKHTPTVVINRRLGTKPPIFGVSIAMSSHCLVIAADFLCRKSLRRFAI